MMEAPNLSADRLTQAVLALPVRDRAALAARIVESIDNDEVELSSAWLDLAERRKQEVLSGKVSTMSADEVRTRVRRHIE